MQNAKRNLLNNDLMIKHILTCITGMSNTDFIPATPRIVASVIVCSFAFYCYVCIYERTFSCFFFVKKSKLGLSSEFLIDHLNSLVRKGLFTRLFFMRACAREREREREFCFVSVDRIPPFSFRVVIVCRGSLFLYWKRNRFCFSFASLFVSPSIIIGGELTRVNFSFLNTKRKDR
jgi:hypothetical protein